MPIKAWLREDFGYAQVKALFEEAFVKEFFDQAKIIQLLEDHHTGKADLQRKIWAIYAFLTWYKVFFIDTDIPKAEPIIYDTF